MTVLGYPSQPTQLAFRDAESPEFAADLWRLLAESTGDVSADRALAALTDRTDVFVSNWEGRAVPALDESLARLAAFSKDQFEVFRTIFVEAGVDLDEVVVPEPFGEFAWASVARAATLALFDVLVDVSDTNLNAFDWVKSCVALLNSERFRKATGIDESDHEDVLLATATGFFRNDTHQPVELAYRDRLVKLSWERDVVHVTRRRPRAVLLGRPGRKVEVHSLGAMEVVNHAPFEIGVAFGSFECAARFVGIESWARSGEAVFVAGGDFTPVQGSVECLALGASAWLVHTDASKDRGL